jgi:hypothetical protein
MAAKLVFEQPEKYGLFRMSPLHQPTYRSIEVNSPRSGIDLRDFARAKGLDSSTLRAHNPHLRGWWIPPGVRRVRAPETGVKPGGSAY